MIELDSPLKIPALLLAGGLGVILIIVLLAPFAGRLGLLDQPNERKLHGSAVPMVGGLAIYLVIVSAYFLVAPLEKILWVVVATTLLVIVGMLDDAFGLSVWVRFLVQVLSAVLVIFGANIWIASLALQELGIPDITLWLGICLTVFSVVGLTNAFNMADGIDGLASGQTMIAICSIIAILGVTNNGVYGLEWILLLFSTVFGFFLVNLSLIPLRRAFLGDAGSLMLGFVIAWILIYYSQGQPRLMHPVAAIWCVTIPVFDAVVVILKRHRDGLSLFAPDRNHLHHLLVDIGMHPRTALSVILVVSLGLNAFGLWVTHAISPAVALVLYAFCLGGFAYGMLHPTIGSNLARKVHLMLR